jgi:hypothetical protein
MTYYECMESFFAFLKVEKVPKMHWNDSNGWGNGTLYAQCAFGSYQT